MRDLIWTLIIVWVVYRLFNAFRIAAPRASSQTNDTFTGNSQSTPSKSDDEKRQALRKGLNEEGEYVDYEEIRHDRS